MRTAPLFFANLTKGKKLSLLATPVITLLLSMKTALIGLTILILLDLITGIGKSLYKKGANPNPLKSVFWKSIKSYLLRKTWKKAYEYGLGVIVVVIFESLVFGTASITLMDKVFTLSELAVIIPSVIEMWSIFENLEEVTKGNVLKRLIMLLPAKMQSLFTGKVVEEVSDDMPMDEQDIPDYD